MTEQRPELLAPAGAEDSLTAALAAGADAVYFGGRSFSNRMRAKNFTDDNLRSAIARTHDAGAKAYITVNTRIRDREADEVFTLCDTILGGKDVCDAIICADFGLAAEIRRRWPHAVLHASTQTSLSSVSDCTFLQNAGFSRLVIPRELSLEEIRALCRETPLEIEMFLHGAHCVSLSGQCLLSYFIGNRSGNRGECAQPCRLPYTLTATNGTTQTGCPLSLADMCLAGRMREVCASGVCSLKIEGRMKTPSYVYGVTKIYRTLLDEGRDATAREIRALDDLFSRGFTDGYFTRRYAAMTSARPDGTRQSKNTPDAVFREEYAARVQKKREEQRTEAAGNRIPLTARFTLRPDVPAELCLSDGVHTVCVTGQTPTPAEGRPLDAAAASRNLTKLGQTAYALAAEDLTCTMADGLWMPASALNDLRRRAAEALDVRRAEDTQNTPSPAGKNPAENTPAGTPPAIRIPEKQERTAEFLDASVFLEASPEEQRAFCASFDRLYVPYPAAKAVREAIGATGTPCETAAVLPVLDPSSAHIQSLLQALQTAGIRRVLAHTAGQILDARACGMEADLSFRGNLTNEAAAAVYAQLGCTGRFASPELPAGAVSALHLGAIVYGRLPAMTLSRCLIAQSKNTGKNPGKNGGIFRCACGGEGGRQTYVHGTQPQRMQPHACRCTLTDRTGAVFPVFGQPDCENIVLNAHPVWMGDRLSSLAGASILHWFFTDESMAEALDILRRYRLGLPGEGRRL